MLGGTDRGSPSEWYRGIEVAAVEAYGPGQGPAGNSEDDDAGRDLQHFCSLDEVEDGREVMSSFAVLGAHRRGFRFRSCCEVEPQGCDYAFWHYAY